MPRYNEFFSTVPVPGKRLHRDPETLKKLIDGQPAQIHSWKVSPDYHPIMLAYTGESHIIGVDFDDEYSFNLALEIDPACPYIAKGIGKGGGHFIYKDDKPAMLLKHITNPNGFNIPEIDLQMGRKLLYLATPANETKELLTEPLKAYDDLTSMPLGMQIFIVSLYQAHVLRNLPTSSAPSLSSSHADSKLHFIVKEALDTPEQYHHKLFNVVTTKKYKGIMASNPKHTEYPYIPDNLPPEESGNAYLVSVATILGRDPSVDQEMFGKAMRYVNSLFSDPYPSDRLEGIISYITSGQSKIDGKAVWQYNPDWNKAGMIYTDNFGNSHEVFAFADKGAVRYLDHNHITNDIEELNTAGAVIDNIKITSKRNGNMTKDRLMERAQSVKLISTPLKDFGAIRYDSHIEFNTYLRNDEQEILMRPELHKHNYKHPSVTLKFLENSLGYEKLYEFFLPFIRRKFTTYEFSPLVMVLYGPPNSGKSAITNGILRPFAKGRSLSLSTEVATEKYDDWKVGKDIVLVDEIHHTRKDLLQKVVQVINTISGSSNLSGIRAMQQSASSQEYPNTITIFVTCNKVVSLSTEAQDRRLVIFKSNSTAAAALGMGNDAIRSAIMEESRDFAYYLATEVIDLAKPKYLSNDWLKDDIYNQYQGRALDFNIAIATAISNGNFNSFCDLMLDKGIDEDTISHSSIIIRGKLHIRIYNSHEHKASQIGLLTDSSVDINKLTSELAEISMARVRRPDKVNGQTVSNKKTVALFTLDTVPQEFLDKLNSITNIAPLDEEEELLLS